MKIVIVGAGKLGKTLIKHLVNEEHDIVVIDTDEDLIEKIVNQYDVLGYTGNGASYDVLVASGAENADLLIAVSSDDEVNILSCLVAKKLNVKQTISRVRNPDYSKQVSILNEELGISTVINPDLIAANEIVRTLQFPSALKVETFANNKVNLIELRLDKESPLIGLSLVQMMEKYPLRFLVCLVKRTGDIIIPRGNFVLKEGDSIYLAGEVTQLVNLLKKLNLFKTKLKSTILLGGSKICYYVAKDLIKSGVQVKIIEKDAKRCDELADALPEALIINGDGTDVSLLQEEGISQVDSFVSLTGLDETNIIMATYCKTHGVAKTIAKVNSEHYLSMLGNVVKLDSVITPKVLSSDVIVRYVRGIESSTENECKTMYHLGNNTVEALEFIVSHSDDKITNLPLKDLKLKKNVLLVSIIREGVVIIPSGKDKLEPNDTLIIISPSQMVKTLGDILE